MKKRLDILFVLILFTIVQQETEAGVISDWKLKRLNHSYDAESPTGPRVLQRSEISSSSSETIDGQRYINHSSQDKKMTGNEILTNSTKNLGIENPDDLLKLVNSKNSRNESNTHFKIHRIEDPSRPINGSNKKYVEMLVGTDSLSDILGKNTSQWDSVNLTVLYDESGVRSVAKAKNFEDVHERHTNDSGLKQMNVLLKSKLLQIDPIVFNTVEPTETNRQKEDGFERSKRENKTERKPDKVNVTTTVDRNETVNVTETNQEGNITLTEDGQYNQTSSSDDSKTKKKLTLEKLLVYIIGVFFGISFLLNYLCLLDHVAQLYTSWFRNNRMTEVPTDEVEETNNAEEVAETSMTEVMPSLTERVFSRIGRSSSTQDEA